MKAIFPRLLALCALGFASCSTLASMQADPEPVLVSQFSGKPVPRFESLRYSAVHGRQGPSLDHPILWRYERAGLPMLIIRETHGWRRVRDKDGDEVWVQARMLSSNQKAVITQDIILYKKPDEHSTARAQLKAGLIVDLDNCEALWCRVKAGRQAGWVQKTGLWGVETSTGGL